MKQHPRGINHSLEISENSHTVRKEKSPKPEIPFENEVTYPSAASTCRLDFFDFFLDDAATTV